MSATWMNLKLSPLMVWASASPLAWPITAAAAVLSMGGCTEVEPHRPLPVDAYDKPIPYPTGTDATSETAPKETAPQDTFQCVPEPCPPNHLDLDRKKGSQRRCIQFVKQEVAGIAPYTGVSIVDINRDGRADIYATAIQVKNRLFVSEGSHFTESTKPYALDLEGGTGQTHILWQDFPNQNLPEFLHMGNNGADHYKGAAGKFFLAAQLTTDPTHVAHWFQEGFLLGTANGLRFYAPSGVKFVEESKKWGLVDNGDARRFAPIDIDNDGDTDLFVANETGKDRLFENTKEGFKPVEDQYFPPAADSPSRDATWVTLAPQEIPRLYVSNYGAASPLWEWQPSKTFSNVAPKYGLQDGGMTVRAAWGDFLNEGSPAVFIARTYEDKYDADKQLSLLYLPVRNAAGAVTGYRDIAFAYGMSGPLQMVGAEWADVDGDKDLDLVTAAYYGSLVVYFNTSRWVERCL